MTDDHSAPLALAYRLSDMGQDIGTDAEVMANPPPSCSPTPAAGSCWPEPSATSWTAKQCPTATTSPSATGPVPNAADLLRDTLGEDLVRRHATGVGEADLAAAMVFLGALLRALTTPIAADENLPAEIRRAGQVAVDAAGIPWSHYGGDSGGW